MIVIQTSLTGYLLMNGTWGVQMALLVASLFNVIIFPNDALISELAIYPESTIYPQNGDSIIRTRTYIIPGIHALMMITTAIAGNQRLNWDGLKQASNSLGLFLNIYLILEVTNVMLQYPTMDKVTWHDTIIAASYLWYEVELGIFVCNIASNALFLLVRSCTHHKL